MSELNSKQRSFLRSMCNTLPTILYIGKDGITENTCQEAWNALEARELIKCSVQKGCPLTAREACQELCEKVYAEPVQCIGNRFSIYRPCREKEPKIQLP